MTTKKGGARPGAGRKPGFGWTPEDKRKMWSGYLPYHIVQWLKNHTGPESQGKLVEKALVWRYNIPLPECERCDGSGIEFDHETGLGRDCPDCSIR